MVCLNAGLFGRELLVVDGTFFKGDNSAERNDTKSQLDRMEARVEKAISEFHQEMDGEEKKEIKTDGDGDSGEPALPPKLLAKRRRLRELRERAQSSPSGQVSLTDPDARLLKKGGKPGIVGYNVQMGVDGKHGLIAHLGTCRSGSDRRQLAPVVESARDAISLADGADNQSGLGIRNVTAARGSGGGRRALTDCAEL